MQTDQINFSLSKAKSQSNDGDFDYNSFLILLRNIDSKDLNLFSPLLDTNFDWSTWTIKDYELALQSINTIALIAHEYTHFLDTTATLWGYQYTHRKILVLSETDPVRQKDQIKVFQLNVSEIKNLHSDLVETSSSNYNDLLSMNHYYTYHKDHGSIIFIKLNYPDNKTDKIPVSMLAVNEGHAYCNEMIYKNILCKKIINKDLRETISSIINKDFEKFLNETRFSEYNILLKLCHINLKDYFNNEEILYLTSSILGFSLDCNDLLLTSFSYLFEDLVLSENLYIVKAITNDMRRAHSRHYLAFKLILIITNLYISGRNKEIIENIARNNNSKYNFNLLLNIILQNDIAIRLGDVSKNIQRGFIEKKGDIFKNKYIFDEVVENTKIYEEDNYIINDLNKYKLIDFILSDDYVVSLKNRVNLNVIEYYLEDLIGNFDTLNDAYEQIKKFHMNPLETEIFLNNLNFSLSE